MASEAIAQTDDAELVIVPGVAAGEGCATEGGCATCPYMKMNSLDALLEVVRRTGVLDDDLSPYFPRSYPTLIGGRTAADLGGEPILHMRHFQLQGSMSPELVRDIESRGEPAPAPAAP